jgi:hypothetical protein
MAAQVQSQSNLVKGLLANEVGAQPGQVALGQITKLPVKEVGDRAVQDAIAEEFKALVVRKAEASMRERHLKQKRIGKVDADPPFQRVE